MVLFTQQMTAMNQILLVMHILCLQEATSLNNSNYSNSKKKRQHKKGKVKNSTASEVLTEKHNENNAVYKRRQISQQTQNHQSENQNYRQISALIEKENITQQKFGQIRNVKYRNRKE